MKSVFRSIKSRSSRISGIFTVACAFLLTGAVILPMVTTPVEAKKRASKKTKTVIAKPEGPLTIVISLGPQRLNLYDGDKKLSSAPISSGARGHRTPTGLYSILQKRRRHFSNLYNSAPMPNMQRITWSGIALHAGHLPGYPASHGCIRLPYGFSKRLFRMTSLGTRVVVAKGTPIPRAISHPNLIKPLPAGDPTLVHKPVQASTSSQDDAMNAANMILGVSQAHAATPPLLEAPEKPTGSELTRASLAAYRQQELIYLTQNVDLTRDERKRAADDLKAANLEVREALKRLSNAKAEAKKLSKTISKAIREGYSLARKMQVFAQHSLNLETPLDVAKAQQRELDLENEIMIQDSELEMARKEAADLSKLIAKLEETLKAKQDQRNTKLRLSTAASKRHSESLKALNNAKRAQKRRDKPITVLVSRKTMKIYVRQGFDPVFSAPIEIDNPEAPIGTQFYSAYSYTDDENDIVWHALTADRNGLKTTKQSRKKNKNRRNKKRVQEEFVETPGLPAQTPKNALDRIKLSQDIRMRLAELIKPGSALFISDEGVSYETGKYTEIIVRTR